MVAATTIPLPFEHAQLPQSHSQHSAFSLPFHTRPHRRRRSDDTERSGDGPKRRNVQTGKEQPATRKQSFTSSIAGSFKFKIPHSKSSPAQLGPGHLNVESSPFFTHEEEAAVVVAAPKPKYDPPPISLRIRHTNLSIACPWATDSSHCQMNYNLP